MFLVILLMSVIRFKMWKSNKQKFEPMWLSPGFCIPVRLGSLQSFQPAIKKRKFFAKTLFFDRAQFHPLMDDNELVDKESCTKDFT